MFENLEDAVEFAKLCIKKPGDLNRKYDVSDNILIEMIENGAEIIGLNKPQIGDSYIHTVCYEDAIFVSVTDKIIIRNPDKYLMNLLYPYYN